MKHLCWFLAVLFMAGACFSLPTLAVDQGDDKRQLIEEVLELYGVKAYMTQIPVLLQAQLEREGDAHPPEVYAALSEAFAEAYRAEGLYEKVVAYFQAKADREQLLGAREWLLTPLSRKMTALELEAATPEAQQQMEAFAAGFDTNPAAKERLALVQALDEAVKATEVTVAVTVATVRALVEGVQPLLPADKRMLPEEIEPKIGRLQAELETTMKYGTWLSFLYTYRSASDDELADYVAYWKSHEGRWLNETTSAALLEAITAAAEDAGGRIAAAALEKRPSGGSR